MRLDVQASGPSWAGHKADSQHTANDAPVKACVCEDYIGCLHLLKHADCCLVGGTKTHLSSTQEMDLQSVRSFVNKVSKKHEVVVGAQHHLQPSTLHMTAVLTCLSLVVICFLFVVVVGDEHQSVKCLEECHTVGLPLETGKSSAQRFTS